jgi:hypothetical protein
MGARARRRGGGRKSATVFQPGLPAAFEARIGDATRGDPCSPLRWVSRSLRNIAKALTALGFRASQKMAVNLPRERRYSCQANRKTREGANHPDRYARFAHINETVKAAIAASEPAISVETKNKELVGDFKTMAASEALEARIATLRQRDRSGDRCHPFAARHHYMEQDRAPSVRCHHHELAWQAAG